jgi:adenylate cyclase class 2
VNPEIEAKFLSIDYDEVCTKLNDLGAVCEQPMRLMRRVVIDSPTMTKNNGFLRVRDEGDRVTMTYKQFDDLSVDGAKEIEAIVSSFDSMVGILEATGLSVASFQESKRETWRLNDAEVVIDEWPWLSRYIEVEAASEGVVRAVAEQLGYDWSKAVFGDVMVAYRAQYPHLTENDTVGRISQVRFNDPLPELLRASR